MFGRKTDPHEQLDIDQFVIEEEPILGQPTAADPANFQIDVDEADIIAAEFHDVRNVEAPEAAKPVAAKATVAKAEPARAVIPAKKAAPRKPDQEDVGEADSSSDEGIKRLVYSHAKEHNHPHLSAVSSSYCHPWCCCHGVLQGKLHNRSHLWWGIAFDVRRKVRLLVTGLPLDSAA